MDTFEFIMMAILLCTLIILEFEEDISMDRGFSTFQDIADEFCKSRNLTFFYVTQGNQLRCESDNNMTEFYNITFQLNRKVEWKNQRQENGKITGI